MVVMVVVMYIEKVRLGCEGVMELYKSTDKYTDKYKQQYTSWFLRGCLTGIT